jgi:hypothetical protein
VRRYRKAVTELPADQLAKFSAWFADFDAARFDQKIEWEVVEDEGPVRPGAGERDDEGMASRRRVEAADARAFRPVSPSCGTATPRRWRRSRTGGKQAGYASCG